MDVSELHVDSVVYDFNLTWRLIKLAVFCLVESFGEDEEVIDWKVFPTAGS